MGIEFSELLDAAERTLGLYFSYDSNLTVTWVFNVCFLGKVLFLQYVLLKYLVLIEDLELNIHGPSKFGDLGIFAQLLCWSIECTCEFISYLPLLSLNSINCYLCPLFYSSQRLHELGDEFKSLPLWRQVVFLWNSAVPLTSKHDGPNLLSYRF